MATNNWVGATSGTSNFWQTGTNWSKGVPGNSSDVAIGLAGTYSTVITAADRPSQIKSLRMGAATGTVRLIENGSLSVTGNVNLARSIFDVGAGGTGSVFGNFTLDPNSTASTEGVFNVGGAIMSSGGTVAVDGGNLFADSVSGGANFAISLAGTIEIGSAISSDSHLAFGDNSANTLLLDDPGTALSAAITGFGGDNKIDVGSLPFSSQYTTRHSGTTLTIESGTSTLFTFANINNPGSFILADDGSGGTEMMGCYAQGTRIRAVDGEVPVEALKPGDLVMTLTGGELAPRKVRWVGVRWLDLAAHPRSWQVAPIRIERGAFADNVPHRQLLLSPDHAIMADGKLICARQLINGATIRQEGHLTSVVYYHVELETHGILLAENLPAESYLDTGNRGFFANSGEPLILHPDLTDETDHPTREANSCAPFVTDEASILPVWQRLADRARALGWRLAEPRTTTQPGLRLVVGSRQIKPAHDDAGRFTFLLPRGASEVRLVSRAAAPTDTRPWLEDRRCLGVEVARLVLRGADAVRVIPLDHPGLTSGWWAIERNGIAHRRWTNGDAVVPLPAIEGYTFLEIHLAGTMNYLAAEEIAQVG